MNIQKTSPIDAGLEALLHRELDTIKEKFISDANHLAVSNLPRDGETFSFYWAEHHSKFENLITMINQHLSSDALLFDVRQSTDAANSNKQDLHNSRKELEDALTDHCKDMSQPPDYNPAKHIGIKTTVAAIALFEGLYTTPIFSQFGLSWIESAIAASLLAIALSSYYDSVPAILRRARTPKEKRIVFAIMWLLPVVFFYFIGTGRADYLTQLSQEDGGEGIIYSPWLFIVTSVIMTSIAMLLSLLQPDKGTKTKYTHYKTAQRKKKELETKLEAIEQQIKATDVNSRSTALSAAQIYEYGHTLEQQVISFAKSGFEDYKKRIVTRKTTPFAPSIQEPYPFPFKTNFNYKSTTSNE